MVKNPQPVVFYKSDLPDATALRQMLIEGIISSSDIVQECLDRSVRFHPKINAIVELLDENAINEAKNPKKGLLSGIPISLKESISLNGKISTYGSIRREKTICTKDADVASLLKEEGAIILARSNTPEFSLGPETDNLHIGRTNNPLNINRTAGGSSGGEAALISTGSTVLGIGTDFGGSIRIPAAFCGLVGFKPVSNSVSKVGIFPQLNDFANSFLSIGPITRSVRDAKLVYKIISKSEVTSLNDLQIKYLRLVYPHYNNRIKCKHTYEAIILAKRLLVKEGIRQVNNDMVDNNRMYKDFNGIITNSFESKIHEFLTGRSDKKMSLVQEGLNQMMKKPTIHNWLFQILIGMSLIRPNNTGLNDMIERTMSSRYKFYDFLGLDGILILPTVGILAPKHGKLISKSRCFGVMTALKPSVFCNILDLPAISLPVWKHRNLISGLVPSVMLIASPGNESTLFELAKWLEPRLL